MFHKAQKDFLEDTGVFKVVSLLAGFIVCFSI